MKTCSISGCEKKHKAKGLCDMHYRRNLNNGSPGHAEPLQSGRGEGEAFLTSLSKTCETDECVKWPFGTNPDGYGKIQFQGKGTSASRAMCIIHRGEPPSADLQASHTCGNGDKGCVNPKHIVWATCPENISMKKQHGTWQGREAHPGAKLTESDVAEIRASKDELTRRDAAQKWGVHPSTIQAVIDNRNWGKAQ